RRAAEVRDGGCVFAGDSRPASAQTGFGAVISAARARWIACDGQVTRIVLGPDGVPLEHGRTLRLFPAHVRRAAEVRDGGCVFAGCSAPPWWCDVHHVLAWIDGGATDLDNAALLCERHHTKVHHGFRVERRPDGRWRTRRPDGTEIRTGPGRTAPPLATAA
ncbi:MAG TPA: HNH endonuclease signature motif containing protein, partial [Geodermatophilus sp.]|nr:HNH endonuclease signature motif containing protein [Geodermatophilus sp.]